MKVEKNILLLLLLFSWQLCAQNLGVSAALKRPVISNINTFTYTGAIQQFIVPNRVTSIQINAIGAKGGTGLGGMVGGAGANITTTLNVTPGQILYVVVGGFPGQSATAKYGFAGNGGVADNTAGNGAAGGGLSGVFSSSNPSNTNAYIVAGGGGGGAGTGGTTGYTGGSALNANVGNAGNGAGGLGYPMSGRYQFGYGATTTTVGVGGIAYDNNPGNNGGDGGNLTGGVGGTGTIWQGAGGGGGGFYGGGGGAGGGSANGGGGGGSSKSSTGFNTFGTPNTTGDGSVTITCLSNSSLFLHLDAGNPLSYSGSGTTWNDLSGNGSHVTLTSTTYNAANGGSIGFNGTSSYANFNANIGSTNVITVEMWVKTNSLNTPTGAMYFGFNKYDVWTKSAHIGFNTSGGDIYGLSDTRVTNLGIEGAWKHLVFVMNSGTTSNNKIYVNSINQTSLTQVLSGFTAANANFNSGAGRISGWRNDAAWLMNLNVASFKIYNRELTEQEITNNFNSTKQRFYPDNSGLSPETASTSAYQIKQDYPNSVDGFYWIKHASINGGVPIKIYADMTTDGGGWTLILKNSSYGGWSLANAIDLNATNPFTKNTDIVTNSTANYSIIKWADYIKKSSSGFQYMIDAYARNSYGGIWTANAAYSFISTSNANTNITLNANYGGWTYNSANDGISQRMPWHGYVGANTGFLGLSSGSGNWWGTLVANNQYYAPAPWIGTIGGTGASPGIIWYWVR
ncbi:fibrinogen-like YCDxxxxGGGW domain-containing protein [Aquirufa regiilacus]|uniref:Fibrinogen-like YCDxxxxGGGW domain-containing protein n=1 Tax=Aquirufa regiilacus TaxID=3024868 RepID=A0ABU3TRK1_9BACT|nr:fibrinogen-like YCDxxxxGGGW domain-containing protein [Aquirufa sp. LEOWEIH-7C]MDU0808302.1 fibrinogen-like YCDxxxxGGGW domain-containing protein [Aquirufa sp. LEOWEIH-7C]